MPNRLINAVKTIRLGGKGTMRRKPRLSVSKKKSTDEDVSVALCGLKKFAFKLKNVRYSIIETEKNVIGCLEPEVAVVTDETKKNTIACIVTGKAKNTSIAGRGDCPDLGKDGDKEESAADGGCAQSPTADGEVVNDELKGCDDTQISTADDEKCVEDVD